MNIFKAVFLSKVTRSLGNFKDCGWEPDTTSCTL